MVAEQIKVYVDTSVFGGVFDNEFKEVSIRFFEKVKAGYFKLVISTLILEEIAPANNRIKNFSSVFFRTAEIISISDEALKLREEYIKANIVSRKSLSDALHVATATVNKIPVIVSWNFKDIVNFKKIPMYNGVNLMKGYSNIGIYSPMEVLEDG